MPAEGDLFQTWCKMYDQDNLKSDNAMIYLFTLLVA